MEIACFSFLLLFCRDVIIALGVVVGVSWEPVFNKSVAVAAHSLLALHMMHHVQDCPGFTSSLDSMCLALLPTLTREITLTTSIDFSLPQSIEPMRFP